MRAARSSREGSRYDVARIREDFPILNTQVHGKPLVYLDNAATTQKPRSVIDATVKYYEHQNANIHRGVHRLSEIATAEFEGARKKVQTFLNAPSVSEIVFVRGATEGINLVAQTFGWQRLKAGDEILISAMEHHSNIVPWQILCGQTGAKLKVANVTPAGELDLESFESLLGERTKMVAVAHVSNALGTVNPVQKIVAMAKARDIPVLIDGAQAVSHLRVDVQALDCDFYVMSSHKLYGPTGIGVLYGKSAWLNSMPPFQGGGDMILSVSFDKTIYNVPPHKFEAGTPDIAGAIGLGAAIDYLGTLDWEALVSHEDELVTYAIDRLSEIEGLKLVGTPASRAGVVSFVLNGVHPHDIGTILDQEGIAIRTGHHCAQPVLERLGVTATARASFGLYNTRQEVDALATGLRKVLEVFR